MCDIDETKAVRKKERDWEHPSGHYLVVEDPEKPSTWHLRVRNVAGDPDHRLMGGAWAALHGGYRGNRYEGPDKEKAIAKLRRLYEAEEMETPGGKAIGDAVPAAAIKLIHESPDHFWVGGYGHVWGDPGRRDLEGDYFTPETDLMPDLVPVKLVTFDHALQIAPDGSRFDHIIGKAAEDWTHVDDVGKWIHAQVDKRARYVDAVMSLVDKGIVAWSSGAVAHLVKRARDRKLLRWPVAEYAQTTTPAEPRLTGIAQLREAYKAAGLDYATLDALQPVTQGLCESDDRQAAELALAQAKLNLLSLRG